jgi:hypothetical protein
MILSACRTEWSYHPGSQCPHLKHCRIEMTGTALLIRDSANLLEERIHMAFFTFMMKPSYFQTRDQKLVCLVLFLTQI